MATIKENLEAALERVAAELAEGDIKPAYSVDGQSVQWPQYRASLIDEMTRLRELINDADDDGGICFEVTETVP